MRRGPLPTGAAPRLTHRDTTQAERLFAKNYAVGDVIQPERDYRKARLERGALYEVVEDGPGNRPTVRGEKGELVEFSPMTCRKLSVYEPERAELAVGYYVAISRAQQEAHIYTDDLSRLPAAVSREHQKHAVLDLERR